MATIKFYLRKNVLSDGTSPLVLKILKDGKPSISHIGINLKHEDWDPVKRRVRKSHPNATKFNNFLLKKLAEANDKAIEAQTANSDVSAKTIIKKIKPNSGQSFFKHIDEYLKAIKKSGDANRYGVTRSEAKHFRNFLNGSDIVFPDITVPLLERYRSFLTNEVKTGKEERNLGPRSVFNCLALIRKVFKKAIVAKDVEEKYYPFGNEGFSLKVPESLKLGHSADDVKLIENVELPNPTHNHARNLWLMSFYFGGVRAADVLRLKWSDFKDSRLYYTMGKNNKPGSLKSNDKATLILAQYESDKRSPDDYIFPDLKDFPYMNDKFEFKKFIGHRISYISGILKDHVGPKAGLTHPLSLHKARHTVGNLAAELNINLVVVQGLFRHVRFSTTLNYMKNIRDRAADDAMAAILGNT